MVRSLRTWPSRLVARPWLLAFVPINAATSGFAVVLPLLILISLHGGWVDVAFAATLFNIAVVLSSILWGYLSDRYPSRRMLLLVNFAGFGVIYAGLAEVSSLPLLFILYTAVGLIAPAGANASNLLILEKFTGTERPNAYASFQEMSMVGSMAGLLVGYFWVVGHDALTTLLYVLAGLAVASAVAVWFGIADGPRSLTPSHVARHPEGLMSRLRPTVGFRIPIPFFPSRFKFTGEGIRKLRRWVREEFHHELPLIMAASLLFNLSANLFNISYTPYLFSLGIGSASIFLVNFSNNFAQGLVFPFSGGLTSRSGPDRLVQRSTYLRSLGYLAIAGFTFAPILGGSIFGANLLAFAVLGGAIALYSTSSSMILFRGLESRDAGSLLGINSALGGVAAIGGAVLSEILSLFGSFRLVFLVSAGALLVSLPLWAAASVAYARRRAELSLPPARGTGHDLELPAATQTD